MEQDGSRYETTPQDGTSPQQPGGQKKESSRPRTTNRYQGVQRVTSIASESGSENGDEQARPRKKRKRRTKEEIAAENDQLADGLARKLLTGLGRILERDAQSDIDQKIIAIATRCRQLRGRPQLTELEELRRLLWDSAEAGNMVAVAENERIDVSAVRWAVKCCSSCLLIIREWRRLAARGWVDGSWGATHEGVTVDATEAEALLSPLSHAELLSPTHSERHQADGVYMLNTVQDDLFGLPGSRCEAPEGPIAFGISAALAGESKSCTDGSCANGRQKLAPGSVGCPKGARCGEKL